MIWQVDGHPVCKIYCSDSSEKSTYGKHYWAWSSTRKICILNKVVVVDVVKSRQCF